MSHFGYRMVLSLSFISEMNVTIFSALNSTDNHILLLSEYSLSLTVSTLSLSLSLWLEWSPRSVLHQHWGYLCSRRWGCHLPLLSPGLIFYFFCLLLSAGWFVSLLGACPVPCHLSLCCSGPLLDHFISFPPLSCSSAPSSDNWSSPLPRMA